VQSIADWLAAIGLSQYAGAFTQADVDLDVLPVLEEADLEKLGVTLGHRKRILKAIAALRPLSKEDMPPAAPAVRKGERRHLTIVFCDLVGSTALSQQLDPEALGDLMRGYRRAAADVIERYDGHVAQYLGDGVMAYFGWPHAHEGDSERAVRAALDMLTAVRDLGSERTLQIRVGVATGPVVVGSAGVDHPSVESLAVGETPNIAARLQGLAAPGQVVVSAETHRLLGDLFDYADLGLQTLKGVIQPVRAWLVLSSRNVEARFEAQRDRGLSPLVGRTSELTLLEARWERAKGGEGQAVLLCAEAGVGKSRLARAVRDRLREQNHAELRYQCSPFHSASALYPVVQQLERSAGFSSEDGPARKLAKLRDLLGSHFEPHDTMLALYAQILSLPADEAWIADLSPQQQKDKTVEALVAQVLGPARHCPVLVVFEDIHWADATTLDFIAAMLDRLETAPVLAIVTYRPDFTPAWLGKPGVTAITLSRLSRREAAVLVDQVASGRLPSTMLEQIVAKADGVPLFAEELTKAVLESGLAERSGAGDTLLRPLAAGTIPSTLRDSLMARIDRIASMKETIQVAAVLGREFSYKLIRAVSRLPDQELEDALEKLVAGELVFRQGDGAAANYVFKHALVRDAAYESVLSSERQVWHGRIVDVLEGRPDELPASEPGVLALHSERAGRTEHAITWHMRAGDHERGKFANHEAIYHFEHALALLQPGPASRETEAKLRGSLGLLYATTSGFTSPLTKQHLDRGRELIGQGVSWECEAQVLIAQSEMSLWTGRLDELTRPGERLSELSGLTGNPAFEIYAGEILCRADMFAGKSRSSYERACRAAALYDEKRDRRLAFEYGRDPGSQAMCIAGYQAWNIGRVDEAFDFADRCLAVGRKIGHPFSLCFALAFAGADFGYFIRDSRRVAECANELVTVAERYGFGLYAALGRYYRGWALASVNQSMAGLDEMKDALEELKAMGIRAILAPRFTAQLAAAFGSAGRADEGLEILAGSPDRAAGSTPTRFAEIFRMEADLVLGSVRSDPERAEMLYREAIRQAVIDEQRIWELRASNRLCDLLVTRGRTVEAMRILQPLVDGFVPSARSSDLAESHELLRRMQSTSGASIEPVTEVGSRIQ
jgi:class 3 adenylate cyclase